MLWKIKMKKKMNNKKNKIKIQKIQNHNIKNIDLLQLKLKKVLIFQFIWIIKKIFNHLLKNKIQIIKNQIKNFKFKSLVAFE